MFAEGAPLSCRAIKARGEEKPCAVASPIRVDGGARRSAGRVLLAVASSGGVQRVFRLAFGRATGTRAVPAVSHARMAWPAA